MLAHKLLWGGNMNRKGRSGFGIWWMALLIIIGGVTLISMIFITRFGASYGTHSGYVTAVEYNQNWIFGNYNVYFKSDAQSSQEDVYCISNDDQVLAFELERAAASKERVVLHYANDFILWRNTCMNAATIVTRMEVATQ